MRSLHLAMRLGTRKRRGAALPVLGNAPVLPWALATSYADIPAGLAAVEDGAYFLEPAGDYHFAYQRSGAAAVFHAPFASSAEAQAREAQITAARAAYASAGAPTDGALMLTATAARYDGRLVQNVNATTAPTLNALAFLFPRDEEGNTTPTRTLSETTDPLSNAQAVQLVYTASTHSLELVNKWDQSGWTDPQTVQMAVQVRGVSGTANIGLGLASRSGGFETIAPSGAWQTLGVTVANYSGSAVQDLALLLATTGETLPVTIEAYGFQCHIHSGPVALPSLADELASESAQHAPATIGRPGALPVDADGWVVPAANPQGAIVPLNRAAADDYTLAVWVDLAKADYVGNRISAASFMNTVDTGNTVLPNSGDLGMQAASGTYGQPYMQPGYSNLVGRVPSFVLDQGPVHMAVRVTRGAGDTRSVVQYINGVPVNESDETIATFAPEALALGGNDYDRSRFQDIGQVVEGPDRWGDAFYAPRALSDAEILGLHQGGRTALSVTGAQMLVMGSFDSLTAFTPSPFWHALADASLRPGTHAMLDAIGGSRHGGESDLAGAVSSNYNSAERQGLRRRALDAASQAHDAVYWLCMYGTNDLVGGVMDPTSATWETGRDLIDAMIFRDIASATNPARIHAVLMTIPPRGDWGDGWVADGSPVTVAAATTNDSKREVARQLYNADCRANYASRGYAHVLDYDSFVPSGFASMQAAASDALANGDNNTFLSDGIHFSGTGGAALAAGVVVPFLAARLGAL